MSNGTPGNGRTLDSRVTELEVTMREVVQGQLRPMIKEAADDIKKGFESIRETMALAHSRIHERIDDQQKDVTEVKAKVSLVGAVATDAKKVTDRITGIVWKLAAGVLASASTAAAVTYLMR